MGLLSMGSLTFWKRKERTLKKVLEFQDLVLWQLGSCFPTQSPFYHRLSQQNMLPSNNVITIHYYCCPPCCYNIHYYLEIITKKMNKKHKKFIDTIFYIKQELKTSNCKQENKNKTNNQNQCSNSPFDFHFLFSNNSSTSTSSSCFLQLPKNHKGK